MLKEHKHTMIFLVCLVGLSILLGVFTVDEPNGRHTIQKMLSFTETFYEPPEGGMTIALVACGWRWSELAVSIKSMLMFTKGFLDIRIFADDRNKKLIPKFMLRYPERLKKRFRYTIYDINIPEKQSADNWKNNLKKCCTQRIFFPELLPDVDQLIYVDTDTLFFVPVEEVWSLFDSFNSAQIAAIAWHNEDDTLKTYHENKTLIPYYQPYGLNSGVILMDLKRMAAANWSDSMDAYFDEYKDIMPYGDQDLMNIFFYYNPELLMKLDCKYNYRVAYCMFGQQKQCLTARTEGVSILHGLPSLFRKSDIDYQGFKLIHDFFRWYNFTENFHEELIPVTKELRSMTRNRDRCRFSFDAILKRLQTKTHIYRIKSKTNASSIEVT